MTEQTKSRPETCPCCGHFTTRGREQRALEYRKRPLSGIDLSKPLSDLIQGIRMDIAAARGKLDDIGMGFTGWRDRLECVQGLLTCGLVALHNTREEMLEHEKRRTPGEKEDKS